MLGLWPVYVLRSAGHSRRSATATRWRSAPLRVATWTMVTTRATTTRRTTTSTRASGSNAFVCVCVSVCVCLVPRAPPVLRLLRRFWLLAGFRLPSRCSGGPVMCLPPTIGPACGSRSLAPPPAPDAAPLHFFPRARRDLCHAPLLPRGVCIHLALRRPHGTGAGRSRGTIRGFSRIARFLARTRQP